MITLIKNTSATFDLRPYLVDRGWSIISPSVAKHTNQNEGYIEYNKLQVQQGKTYEYSFYVQNRTNGSLRLTIGGSPTTNINSNGYFQGELTAVNNDNIKIWSDGNLEVRDVNIQLKLAPASEVNGKEDTITWSEQRKKWVTFKDIVPESGFSMFTSMFTLKNGELWKHVVDGTTPNNFYGVQYSSSVKFPIASVGVKTYHTIALHSNKILGTIVTGITTQLGQITDLVNYDFNTVEGIHYANRLRDTLLNEKLKGRYIVVELTDEETKTQKLQLFKIVVKGEISSPNE